MRDIRQIKEYAEFMRNIGWIIERKDNANYFIKKFPLIGSFIKIQRPEILRYKDIKILSEKYRAFQIVIEPINNKQKTIIKNYGFKQSKNPFLPSKTIHINLTKSEKILLKEMHYKTRYNIKAAKRNKLQVTSSKNIQEFADFWQKCALKQRGMFLSQKKDITELYKVFGKKANLVLCHSGKDLFAGILMVRTNEIAYYMYAASSDAGKKLFAPTLSAWETIKLAKKLRCKIFDFEGIYDERFPLKSWLGFSRFKKSFGGREIEYPGAFVKYRIPF